MSKNSYLSSKGSLYCGSIDEVSRGWVGSSVTSPVSSFIGEANYRIATSLVTGYYIQGITRVDYSKIVYVPDINEVVEKVLLPDESFTFPIIAPIEINYGKLEYSDLSNVESESEIPYTTVVKNNPKWDMNDFIILFGVNVYSDATGYFNEKNLTRLANIENLSYKITKTLTPSEVFELPFNTHLSVTKGSVKINGVYRSVGFESDLEEGSIVRACWKVSELASLMTNNYFYPTIYGIVDNNRIYQMINVTDPSLSYYTELRLIASEDIAVDLDNDGFTTYVSTGNLIKDNYQSFYPLGANYEAELIEGKYHTVGDKLGSSNQKTILKTIIPLPCGNVKLVGIPVVSIYQDYSRTAVLQYSLDNSNWITFTDSVILSLNQNQKVYMRQIVDTTDYGSITFKEFTHTVGKLQVYIDYSCFNSSGVWIKTQNSIENLGEYCQYVIKIDSPSEYVTVPFTFDSEPITYDNEFTFDFSKFKSTGLWLRLDNEWILKENKIYFASDKFKVDTGSIVYNSDENYINAIFEYTFDKYGLYLNLCNNKAERLFTINIGKYIITYVGQSSNSEFYIKKEPNSASTYLTKEDSIFYSGSINEFNKLDLDLDINNKFTIKSAMDTISTKVDFSKDIWEDTSKTIPPKTGYLRIYGDTDKTVDFYNVKKSGIRYYFYNIDKIQLLYLDETDLSKYGGYIMIQGYLVSSNKDMVSFITKENNSYFKEIREDIGEN